MTQGITQQIGARLRQYRQKQKYTIEELALKAGMHPAHLAKIERAERNCTLTTLDKIVAALGIPYPELFDFGAPITPPADPMIDKTVACLRGLTVKEQETIYDVAARLAEKK